MVSMLRSPCKAVQHPVEHHISASSQTPLCDLLTDIPPHASQTPLRNFQSGGSRSFEHEAAESSHTTVAGSAIGVRLKRHPSPTHIHRAQDGAIPPRQHDVIGISQTVRHRAWKIAPHRAMGAIKTKAGSTVTLQRTWEHHAGKKKSQQLNEAHLTNATPPVYQSTRVGGYLFDSEKRPRQGPPHRLQARQKRRPRAPRTPTYHLQSHARRAPTLRAAESSGALRIPADRMDNRPGADRETTQTKGQEPENNAFTSDSATRAYNRTQA